MEANSVGVGNCGVGVAVNGDDGRQTGSHIVDRRDAARDLTAVLHTGQPGYSVGLHVGTVEQIFHVGDAVPIDDGRNLELLRTGAFAVQAGGGGQHSGG